MTPEQERLRDMWLAEMWPTVHEYVPPVDPRPRPVDRAEENRRKKAA